MTMMKLVTHNGEKCVKPLCFLVFILMAILPGPRHADSREVETPPSAILSQVPRDRISAPQTAAQRIDKDQQERERKRIRELIIRNLEATIGVEAARLYVTNMDNNAGEDDDISVIEAPEFARNAIVSRLLAKMHAYDKNFPGGGTKSVPSFLPQLSVKSKDVYEKEWKTILCEKDKPYSIVKHDARSLGFSISDEAVKKGVDAACHSK
jgi:hypothetical protein